MTAHFTWQSAVLKSDCESTTKYVLLVVGTYMNQHGSGAFPSYNTLADAASLGRSTIIKHIDLAAEKGWIRKTVRPKRNQEHETNIYDISFPNHTSGGPSDALGGPSDALGGPVGVPPSPFGGSGVVHKVDPNTPPVTPQISPQRKDSALRLPADWEPSDEDVIFCKTERPDLNVRKVAAEFRDYWIAQPGAKGRKTDWPATWRNWVRRQRAAAQGYQGKQEKAKAFMDVLTGRSDSYDANDPFTIDAPATRIN